MRFFPRTLYELFHDPTTSDFSHSRPTPRIHECTLTLPLMICFLQVFLRVLFFTSFFSSFSLRLCVLLFVALFAWLLSPSRVVRLSRFLYSRLLNVLMFPMTVRRLYVFNLLIKFIKRLLSVLVTYSGLVLQHDLAAH